MSDDTDIPKAVTIPTCIIAAIIFSFWADYQFEHHRYGMFIFNVVYIVAFTTRLLQECGVIRSFAK